MSSSKWAKFKFTASLIIISILVLDYLDLRHNHSTVNMTIIQQRWTGEGDLDLDYTYQVNGITYKGTAYYRNLKPFRDFFSKTSRRTISRMTSEFSVGSIHEGYYQDDKPQCSRLESSSNRYCADTGAF